MILKNKFTRYQKIIIYIYISERTVPNTIKVLESMTGEEYKHKSYVRATVKQFRDDAITKSDGALVK